MGKVHNFLKKKNKRKVTIYASGPWLHETTPLPSKSCFFYIYNTYIELNLKPTMEESISQSSIEDICKQIHGNLGNITLLVRVFMSQSTQHECQKIREKYMEMYNEDLFDHLHNKIDGGASKTCTILSLLMINPHERDAIVAKNAIFKERDCVNYKALIEIYVGRKSSHFFLIQQAYQSKFRRHLDQDIMSIEPPHSYQKVWFLDLCINGCILCNKCFTFWKVQYFTHWVQTHLRNG